MLRKALPSDTKIFVGVCVCAFMYVCVCVYCLLTCMLLTMWLSILLSSPIEPTLPLKLLHHLTSYQCSGHIHGWHHRHQCYSKGSVNRTSGRCCFYFWYVLLCSSNSDIYFSCYYWHCCYQTNCRASSSFTFFCSHVLMMKTNPLRVIEGVPLLTWH